MILTQASNLLDIHFRAVNEPVKLILLTERIRKWHPRSTSRLVHLKQCQHIQHGLSHTEFTEELNTPSCAPPPHFFFKQMPGELQVLIIFLHLKVTLSSCSPPPFFPLPSFLQPRVNEKKSVYCTIWHLAAEVAGLFGYQVICCLIEIFSLDSLPCRHSVGMQLSSPVLIHLPLPAFLLYACKSIAPVCFLSSKKKK